MLSAVYWGPGDIRPEEREIPSPGPRDVLIRVSHVGICGSDLEAYQNGGYAEGTIIGHEFSGIVEKVGSEVSALSRGERVTAAATVPCGTCRCCRSGRPSLCTSLELIGVNADGAMAEYYCAAESLVYRLPKEIALDHAPLIDPLSNVVHAVRISSFRPGASVAVVGAGPIGLLLTDLLHSSGAGQVAVFETNPARLALARKVGADHGVDPSVQNPATEGDVLTGGEGFDVVFVASGAAKAVQSAYDLVGPAGEVLVIGIVEQVATADYLRIVMSELTVRGSYLGFNEIPTAIDLLARRRVRGDLIVTRTVKGIPGAIEDGFPSLARPTSVDGKVVVEVHGGSR
ncbi:MAG TPA: alcohol dehydrogenase catalytic domain-containing protein [Thermoplasmata archaeon]|nr:alcohol dehydrogenase catalytic domain-containing protein [Thermoplasmata archaeon]